MKVGIIGCGGIAGFHVSGYQAAGAQITGVTDCNADAAKAMAADTGATVYANYRELIDVCKPDAISICTPPIAHEEAAIYALENGVSVLCEKPMTISADSAHRMREAADKSNGVFMPAFRHRFLPANIALRDIVASGKIGDVVFFNNIFCGPAFDMEKKWFTKKSVAGGGCIIDTNSHSVDLFRFIIGEISEQCVVMYRHFKTTDVEDAGTLNVKAENGAIGIMQSAFVAGAGRAFIDIIGTKGRARYDYFASDKVQYMLTEDKDWTDINVVESWGFTEEVAHFVGAVKGEYQLACGIEDGVRVTEVICSAYENSTGI